MTQIDFAGCGAAVNVIVTCSNRKTRPVPPTLRLDSVPLEPAKQRARNWIARLIAPDSPEPVAAQNLYAGEHWSVARGMLTAASESRLRLWVCSAGYGLISPTAMLRPYAATFSGSADHVDDARHWWKSLGNWEGPQPGKPRSIAALAVADPQSSFVLALSPPYLDACADDIEMAAASISDQDRLMIISVGARKLGGLAGLTVPGDARLQSALGGTRQALNARIAARLVSFGIRSRAEAAGHLSRLLAAQPPVLRFDRRKLTNEELSEIISLRLTDTPSLSASRMLRELRDAGLACEQQRFAHLHRAVVGGRT